MLYYFVSFQNRTLFWRVSRDPFQHIPHIKKTVVVVLLLFVIVVVFIIIPSSLALFYLFHHADSLTTNTRSIINRCILIVHTSNNKVIPEGLFTADYSILESNFEFLKTLIIYLKETADSNAQYKQ